MAKEYIEREAAYKFMLDIPNPNGAGEIEVVSVDDLDSIPAADVAPVRHGRWILKDDGRAHCSECDTAGNSYVWHYCPNCGAKMDGDGD